LKLNRREREGIVILDLEGKILGGEDAEPLRAEIERVADGGCCRLLLNLAGVPWLNSSGLGVLLSGYLRLRGNGRAMKLLNVQERVREILTTTKLIHLLEVFDDEEKAIASFTGEESGSIGPA